MKRSLDSIHQAHLVIEEMDKLLETGFEGRELKLVNLSEHLQYFTNNF